MDIKSVSAYALLKKEKLEDIRSTGYLLCHKKSGARVMLIENEDENKVFNITFRTPPKDSTGVAHILEHSVLCGSEKFPLKDPFVELVKGSLNTFLNAMTFPDKTMYPVASCNDQDFQNLMHVYLDAVFYPNIYKKEEIFRQEGWSYEIESEDAPLCYNGVVYNEMKGVFSSSDELLERETMNVLFPDTPYGVESGGDPAVIPELTYEQFLDFHRKYYHPSNSYIYLYGNMNMEEKLEFLDREYLSAFDAREVKSEISLQKPFDSRRQVKLSYPILENESQEDNTYLSFCAAIGKSTDITLAVAFEVLDYALMTAPGAPLKQALLDAGIGKDIYGSYDDGIYQPVFQLVAKNANEEDMERFSQIITETLKKLAEEKIDRKALAAGINYIEFRFREADYSSYPKGLIYGMDVFNSWLYDENLPFQRLHGLRVFEELKAKADTGYFEELVRKYLLDNPHAAYIVLSPEKGLAARREQETAEKLKSYKESLTDEQIRALVQRTKALKNYQEQEESAEDLKCIPMLKRTDIRREAECFCNKEYYVGDTLVLHHDVDTNGIAYLKLYFDFSQIPDALIPYVGLLKSVLGYVDTENYSYGELFNEINANTGGIACGVEFFQNKKKENLAFFAVSAKALKTELSFAFEMIREILLTSSLENEKRLYEIIARLKSRLQVSIQSAGHSAAVQRALSYNSSLAWLQEKTCGIAYYQFLEKLEADFDNQKEEIRKKLKTAMEWALCRENLKVSVTGDEEICRMTQKEVEELKKLLHVKEEPSEETEPGCCPDCNEGFMTAGQVQYVAQVGNFVNEGLSYTGALQILKVILNYGYLWTNIRVKGGAYGCMSGFKRNGESYLVSYRDPHLKNTLEIFDKTVEFLRQFSADEREMTKYIIGTISGLDAPKTPKMKGQDSAIAYFSGVTLEELQKERDQILDAKEADIRALAEIVEAVLKNGSICVIGSENKIEQEKDVFGEIKHLIS